MFSRKVVVVGAVIIVLIIIVAAFAPWLAPYDPYETNLKEALDTPSKAHLLGTDALGRDTLSRIIYGSRTSLLVGIVSIFIAATLGLLLGLIAGYYGGVANNIIMRLIDCLMAFPMILLALVIASVLGGGLNNVMIAIGIGLTSVYARLMCGQVLSIRENDYILAGKSLGSSNIRTMFWHILPNTFPSMIVLLTLQLGGLILAEAGLSFLGVGITPPTPAWGAMVADGRRYLLEYPWLSLSPGLAIMLVVFAFNLVGDGLRDALDPRLRGIL